MDGLISIIIPVYNSEEHLALCLDSVVGQTYKNLEIIVVNDGSSDGSKNICEEYALKDSRIKVIYQENLGVCGARNSGLAVMTGDYVSFVDSDDYIEKNMYDILMEDLLANNCDMAVGGAFVHYGRGKIRRQYKRDMKFLSSGREAIQNMLTGKYYRGHLWGKLYKAALFKDKSFERDIEICEDSLMVLLILLEAEKVYFNSTPLYNYVVRKTGLFYGSFQERHYSGIVACERIIETLKTRQPDLVKYGRANYFTIFFTMLARLLISPSKEKTYYLRKMSKSAAALLFTKNKQ